MELQELITRGRFVLASAPGRQQVFALVNSKRSTKDIAAETGKTLSNTIRDIQKLRDIGLIEPKPDKNGRPKRVNGATVYQKVPVVRHLSLSHFRSTSMISAKIPKSPSSPGTKASTRRAAVKALKIPNANEIVDICSHGEDQVHEFKAAGADTRVVAKEIAAFLHTRQGGMIIYGVEDDGRIAGAGTSRQKFDQSVQNSVHNTISPAPNIRIHSVNALRTELLIVIVQPWNRREVYFYENRAYIRKGTNALPAKPEEIRKLHKGDYIV